MSFTFLDLGSENFEFRANIWNWKPTLEIIKSFDIVDEGKLRQMSYNATGAQFSHEEAQAIGEKIRDEILPKLEPNKRMFGDLSVTDAPDDGTFHGEGDGEWKNYSASYGWLKDFSEFCLKSEGFQVF
ncbi:MAG TPA: hypothetical protein VGP58_05070 [Pyrinomonadaceae bacterium]|jgi:hypothetical protein|nr:hypothetical protein [Pyrinomonadaceae bacterium]